MSEVVTGIITGLIAGLGSVGAYGMLFKSLSKKVNKIETNSMTRELCTEKHDNLTKTLDRTDERFDRVITTLDDIKEDLAGNTLEIKLMAQEVRKANGGI